MSLSVTDLKPLSEGSFLPAIQSSLQQLFQSADSAVVKLAQEAEENAEQNRHFESAQGLRIVRHEITDNFSKCLLTCFQPEVEEDSLEADTEHVESLRNMMSVDVDAWRADTSFAAALIDLKERLNVVDHNIKNPLRPERFVDCFLQTIGSSDVDVHTKMLVLRMFEGQVYGKLERYVRAANDALAASGVLPDLHTQPGKLTTTMNAIVIDKLGESAAAEVSEEDNTLQLALADLQANDYEKIDEMLSIDFIVTRLGSEPVRDLFSELQTLQLITPELSGKVKLQLEKLELVGKLFEFILSDQTLPVEAKTLLSYLQLPFARVALTDQAFLQESKHPAKVLLNEITRVCASWLPDRDSLANDPLFKKLTDTVQTFIESERLEKIDYKSLLLEFLAFRELQRQKDMETAQRFLDGQYGASATDVAREDVSKVLEQKVGQLVLPDAGIRILEDGWNNVLYICALQKGLESPEWKRALSVVDELLSTFQLPETYSSRSEFLLKLPGLLKSLRIGLTSIELSPALIEELFLELEDEHIKQAVAIAGDFEDLVKVAAYEPQEDDELFTLELEKLSEKAAEKEASKAKEESADASEAVTVTEMAVPDAQIESTLVEDDVSQEDQQVYSNETMLKLTKLGQGSSLIWNKPEGQVRCKIAAHIKPMKKYIITDRAGAKIADILEDEMAQKIESQEIDTVDSDQIFDRALESVIGDIREHR